MIMSPSLAARLKAQIYQRPTELASENGLHPIVRERRFTADNALFNVELAASGRDSEPITREAERFPLTAHAVGLFLKQPVRTVRLGNERYKIVGYNSRNSKRPVIIQNDLGQRFKLSVESTRRNLEPETNVSEPPSDHSKS